MIGGNFPQEFGPEVFFVVGREDVILGDAGDPRVFAEFALQLPWCPSGVAGKCTYQRARLLGPCDGIFRGDAGGKFEFMTLWPHGGEGQMFLADWSSEVNPDIFQWFKLIGAEEVTHGLFGRLIEDQAVGSFFEVMLGEENDAFVEYAVAK